MKKIIVLILALAMLVSLISCGIELPNVDSPLNRDPGNTPGGNQGNNNPGGQTPGGDIGYGDNIPWPSNEFTNAVPKPNMNLTFQETNSHGFDGVFSFATMDDAKAYVEELKSAGVITTGDERTIMGIYSYNATDKDGKYEIMVSFIPNQGCTLSIQKNDNGENPGGNTGVDPSDNPGGQVISGENWPDNEFTRLVPKPNMTVQVAFGDSTEFSVTFTSDTTLEAVKAYAEQLKGCGFTVEPETFDEVSPYGVITYTYSASTSDGPVGYRVELVYNSMGGIVASALSISKFDYR